MWYVHMCVACVCEVWGICVLWLYMCGMFCVCMCDVCVVCFVCDVCGMCMCVQYVCFVVCVVSAWM